MKLVVCAVLALSGFAAPVYVGDFSVDSTHQTWSASPMPNGGTYYSNGLDVLEVSPSGPSSAYAHGWTRDGRETTSTIYTTPRYDQPREPSLSEWFERTHHTNPSEAYPRAPERR